ncbi:tetratricopeptide repeat protein [Gymnodinialimonas ulvae]|uniref:tetratricopeptide repeat protein n=1 Tax=Gymnodinialimonas ulvae TaxID=3126504 RepID=UPI003098BA5A
MSSKKIRPPEEMTSASEGYRNAVDAAVSAVPAVGGPLATLGRHVLPSERDKKTAEWHCDVSKELNEHSDRLEEQTRRHLALEGRTTGRLDDVTSRLDIVEQKTPQKTVRSDFSDIALKPGRRLIEQRQYVTALGVLEDLERDGPSVDEEPQWHAKITSLKGTCQLNLGEEEQAGALFLKAYDLDPQSDKIRSNAVAGFLFRGDLEQAVQLAQALLNEEPDVASHWLNFVQANGAIGADLSYLDEVPPAVRHDQDVMLTTVNVLRARDDIRWRAKARDALAEHPDARAARRYASEAALDEIVEIVVSQTSTVAEVASARARARTAAEDLSYLWTTLLETEVPARRTHLSLLQNAVTGYRISGDSERAMDLIETAIDDLIEDEVSRTIVAAVALDVGRDDVLERISEMPFKDRAIMLLEWAVRKRDWNKAVSVVETHAEDLDHPGEIPSEQLLDVLRAISENEADSGASLVALANNSEDPATLLTISRLARRAEIDAPVEIALRRAIEADDGNSRLFRLNLAEEAARLDWQDDVIDLLQDHVDPTIAGPERFRLAVAHARVSKPRQSGEAFFREVRPHADGDADLQKAGGHFMMALGKPREAVPWFRRSLVLEPNQAHTLLALWQALGRSNQKRPADKLLDDVVVEDLLGQPSDFRPRTGQFTAR